MPGVQIVDPSIGNDPAPTTGVPRRIEGVGVAGLPQVGFGELPGGQVIAPANMATESSSMAGFPGRKSLLVVPGNSSLPLYVCSFTLAPTVAMDLFNLSRANSGAPVLRVRRVVLVNPGSQTAAGLVALQVGKFGAVGTGGAVNAPSRVDATAMAFSANATARSGDTASLGAFEEGYTIPVWVPAAAGPFTPVALLDLTALQQGMQPNPVGGGKAFAIRHPGAVGAANFSGYVEFTVEGM